MNDPNPVARHMLADEIFVDRHSTIAQKRAVLLRRNITSADKLIYLAITDPVWNADPHGSLAKLPFDDDEVGSSIRTLINLGVIDNSPDIEL